jgi:hypothetical protein
MKAFSIIWGVMAVLGLIAILTGATHHWITCLGSAAMSYAMWPNEEDNEQLER